MFENLSDKFDRAFKVLKGQGQITEINVAETLKEVRRALLDADVDFKTAKEFTSRVKDKAMGEDVLTSVSPGQLMTKICHDELKQLMGGEQVDINMDQVRRHSLVSWPIGLPRKKEEEYSWWPVISIVLRPSISCTWWVIASMLTYSQIVITKIL
jgi:signal recognition particle GTPase